MQTNEVTTDFSINWKDTKKWLEHGEILEAAKKFNLNITKAYSIVQGKSRHFEFAYYLFNKAMVRKQKFINIQNKLTHES